MKKIKKYTSFVNEADNPLDPDYLRDIERRARQEHGERMQRGEIDPRNFMEMVNQLQRIQNEGDNISKLEDLAKAVIEDHFGSILDGIELDYRLVRQGDDELSDMADRTQSDEEEDEEDYGSDFEIETEEGETSEEDLGAEVDKRKLINNLTQGAAKNTHRIIHSEIAKNGLDEIDEKLFSLIDKMIKTNEWIEWQVSPQDAIGMMQNSPNGASEVVFEDDEEEIEREEQEDNEEREEQENKPITVKARAIDFPVLLHELVKGIYEAIAMRGLPQDMNFAEKVMGKTDTLRDEFYDLRNGMYIKQDLDSFIAKNPKIGEVDNGLEFVYGAFYELPAQEFVELFKGIIAGTDEARQKIDALIDETLDPVIAWYKEEDLRASGIDTEDISDTYEPPMETEAEPEEVDYSKMSKRDLQEILDDALDRGDFKTAGEVGKFI